MRLLEARAVGPLDRPAPLAAHPAGDPVPPSARRAQHDADNVIAFVRGGRDVRERRDAASADARARIAAARRADLPEGR